jgi:hypothetical protein
MKRVGMRKPLVAMLLGCTMMLASCSTAWIGEAEQIVATLIPATANLVTLVATLQGGGISAADAQTIQSAGAQAGADLQLMQSLIGRVSKGRCVRAAWAAQSDRECHERSADDSDQPSAGAAH